MRRALNAVELIIALLVLILVAAIAVPRLSRAAAPEPPAELRERLSWLRCAIELYFHEHGTYPAQTSDGVNPPGSPEAFVNQLTLFSDRDGVVSRVRGEDFRFGPYLRLGIPACPVPPNTDQAGVCVVSGPLAFQPDAPFAGWIYNCETGEIIPNSDASDAEGVLYSRY